jgi:hypothetical protein
MRRIAIAVAALVCSTSALAETYKPAPPEQIPFYSPDPYPCHILQEARIGAKAGVVCPKGFLEERTLRELSIRRNTIFGRYGWDGYRKPWLRAYFHSQPWFKPNKSFHYSLLTEADRANVHFVAIREQSWTEGELKAHQTEIYIRYGKVWGDKPKWLLRNGKTVASCHPESLDLADPEDADAFDATDEPEPFDCQAEKTPGYKPDPRFSEAKISADDRVELGLISRALGQFSVDDSKRDREERSLDSLLDVDDLRQLSLRDLRLLRNTIFARRGRQFVSPVLQTHFANLGWYHPDPSYTDDRLRFVSSTWTTKRMWDHDRIERSSDVGGFGSSGGITGTGDVITLLCSARPFLYCAKADKGFQLRDNLELVVGVPRENRLQDISKRCEVAGRFAWMKYRLHIKFWHLLCGTTYGLREVDTSRPFVPGRVVLLFAYGSVLPMFEVNESVPQLNGLQVLLQRPRSLFERRRELQFRRQTKPLRRNIPSFDRVPFRLRNQRLQKAIQTCLARCGQHHQRVKAIPLSSIGGRALLDPVLRD